MSDLIREERIVVKDTTSILWKSIDGLRGELPSNDYHVILFLLFAYKDKLFSIKEDVNLRFKDELIGQLKHIKPKLSDEYKLVLDYYTSVISNMREKMVRDLIVNFSNVDKSCLENHFSEIFDSLLNQIVRLQGKVGRESLLPLEISLLMCELADVNEDSRIFNPFAGVGSFRINFGSIKEYYGQEINPKIWCIGVLRLMAYEKMKNSSFLIEDSIASWPNSDRKFDLVISSPPLNLKYDPHGKHLSIEIFLIDRSLKSLSDNGKAVLLLPRSFFTSNRKGHREIRDYLLKNGLIECIIDLPSKLMFGSNISCTLLVLNKSNASIRKNVLLIDASAEFISVSGQNHKLSDRNITRIVEIYRDSIDSFNFSRSVSIKELLTNNSFLATSKYVLDLHLDKSNDGHVYKLAEIMSVHKGSIFEDAGRALPTVQIKDLNNNIKFLSDKLERHLPKKGFRYLDKSALLISSVGSNFRFSYFEYEDQPILYPSTIFVFEVDLTTVNLVYLLREFTKDYFTYRATLYSSGSVVSRYSLSDFLELQIKLPSILSQNRLEPENIKFFHEKDKNLDLLDQQRNLLFEENAYLRHSIAGPLGNVKAFFKEIMLLMENNPNALISDLLLGNVNDNTPFAFPKMRSIVQENIDKIDSYIKKQLDVLSDIQQKELLAMDIDAFLNSYIEELRARKPKIHFSYDSFVNFLLDEIDPSPYVTIMGNPDLLKTLLDNLVENAERHAFQDNGDNKLEFVLLFDDEENVLSLEVSNTGNSWPKDYSLEDFLSKGSMTGSNAGTGYGGWYIQQILNKLNGKIVDIYDNSIFKEEISNGYSTSIAIELPLTEVMDGE